MSPGPVLELLSRAPFTLPEPGTRAGSPRRGARALLDLLDQPGSTWQQRWLASSAQAAGAGWKQPCASWLDERGVHVRQRLDLAVHRADPGDLR